MNPELMQQYFSLLSHVSTDRTDQAQAVLSNILSAKQAAQLTAHNQLTAERNAELFKRDSEMSNQPK